MTLDGYYEKLKAASVIRTQADLSRLFGKSPSYVSSRKAKNKEPSLDALTHLFAELDELQTQFDDLIRHGEDLSVYRIAASGAVYRLKQDVLAGIKARCGKKVRNG